MDAEEIERTLAETRFAAELRGQFEALAERAPQPRRRRRWVVVTAVAGVATAALLGSVALAGGFDSDSTKLPEPPLAAESVYPTNASGLTYGAHQPLVEEPDLVEVLATNGKQGYCLKTDLWGGEPPKTPEEAIAGNERSLRGYTVPVYESDGVTQIGVFQVGGPGSKAIGKLADGTTVTQEADADGNIVTTTTNLDGTVTIETKAPDGTVTTKTGIVLQASDLTPSPRPTPSASATREPDKPRDWLLASMSDLARRAGDAKAKAWWELQSRYYLKRIEGESWPSSAYAQWASVWLVILHGDFPGGSWRYWLLDRDSHNVVSQGQSDKPFNTSRIPPPQGPITLGEK